MRLNQLECSSLETLSSQVLEFEGKARVNQFEHLSDASFGGKLLVLSPIYRLDWKVIASYEHSSLFGLAISEWKKFHNVDTWKPTATGVTASPATTLAPAGRRAESSWRQGR